MLRLLMGNRHSSSLFMWQTPKALQRVLLFPNELRLWKLYLLAHSGRSSLSQTSRNVLHLLSLAFISTGIFLNRSDKRYPHTGFCWIQVLQWVFLKMILWWSTLSWAVIWFWVSQSIAELQPRAKSFRWRLSRRMESGSGSISDLDAEIVCSFLTPQDQSWAQFN